MADIGRSTLVHAESDSIPDYSETGERLTNWGNWLACVPGEGASLSSAMFKDMTTGYRVSSSRDTAHDEDEAIECDRIIATFCKPMEISVLLSRYVYNRSSRDTAKAMSGAINGITRHDVLRYLDNAVARIDMAYLVIQKR